jgi:hypothetical protein
LCLYYEFLWFYSGCEDCNKLYQNESNCPIHKVNSIIDLAVQTRARASLPATHLRIMKIKTQDNLNNSECSEP